MSIFISQKRQKNYDELQKRIEDFEAKERLNKLEADISKSPKKQQYNSETQGNIDNYLQVLSRNQEFETQIRQLKVKKDNYERCLERAVLLNPDEDIDVRESKLSKFVTDLVKKIQRLEKKQKAIGDSLKIIQTEVRI